MTVAQPDAGRTAGAAPARTSAAAASFFRSPVPDLLFEDDQDARLAEIAPLLDAPEALDASTPLHRLTVFLTYRCNLACTYCKTIARGADELAAHPQKRDAFDLAAFERLLDANRGSPVRHLHFTGGEATLVADLPAMLRLARRRGVERLSVTTNGTLPPRRYLDLAAAGLDELRVSLDSADACCGDALARRPGAWAATVRTLAALGRARRGGAPFFLIVNTVVSRANRRRLPEIVRFLLRFFPDDVKLITEVDGRDGLGAFPEAAAVRAEVEALLGARPPGALPLLRRKLRTVFAPDAIGLETVRPPAGRRWRCHVPLTERTVDARFYYPCSVYVRERGAPLGPLADAPEVQRARSARFAREADCLADPICRRYCLHCTRTFNCRANEARP
jgi:pyruvate-formate lyase-activating enzyme